MHEIKVENLYKKFPSEFSLFRKKEGKKEVLRNINFSVKRGEIFCIVGPNGAGKTTLIKILCGLILPDSGKAYVNGYNVVEEEYEVKSSIGLVTGYERSFYWRLTGRQNLEFFGKLYEISGGNLKKKIDYLADLLDMTDELDKRFQKCSSGFQQRIAIARALLQNPEILFMDEPTRSLDPAAAKSLRIFIKQKLSREANKTVFFATHDLLEAEFLADRIALINKGEILICGSVEELKETSNKQNLEELFSYYINDAV